MLIEKNRFHSDRRIQYDNGNHNHHHHHHHQTKLSSSSNISGASHPLTPTSNVCKHMYIANNNNNLDHHQQQQSHNYHRTHPPTPSTKPQTLPRNIKENKVNCDLLKNRASFNEQQPRRCSMNEDTIIRSNSQTNCSVAPMGPMEQCSINATMTIRRLLQLYELGEYREAANIIGRLPYGTFRAVVLDLPVDVFVEAIPSSLPILDALYAKVFFSGRDLLAFGFKFLHPENVVSHMIKMFAICDLYSHPGSEESIAICKKLLKVILIADPSLRKQLLIKKALIDRAVEGMGHHGLVGTSNDALMNLHEALKLEFERVIQQYKGAIAKIDELSSTTKNSIKDGGPITRSLSQGPAPTFSSHQRLLSLKQEEIQERLNKNRSLLCALEPCFRTNHSLQILLAILQKRIDYDKETLFQFGQLSKEYASNGSSSSSSNNQTTNNSTSQSAANTTSSIRHKSTRTLLANQFERDSVVAPVLMRFSHGCSQVLNLLKEIQQQQQNGTAIENDDEQHQQQQQSFQNQLTAQCTYSSVSVPVSGCVPTDSNVTANAVDMVTEMSTEFSTQPTQSSSMMMAKTSQTSTPSCCSSTTTSVLDNQQQRSNHQQTIVATDDSSDISGYHSDSDMSPISTQSPLANKPTKMTTNSVAASQKSNESTVSCNVAIMTGHLDGTTLLDGQVTVNSGHQHHHQHQSHPPTNHHHIMGAKHSSVDAFGTNARQQQQHNCYVSGGSICRIEIDGKPPPPTENASSDYETIRTLRQQLMKAETRIKQMQCEQNRLEEKLLKQSKQLLDENVMFENLDETNQANVLVRRYEYLYSQVRVDVIDALDQFDELKESNELKIKLLFSIVVLAHRSTEQTFKDLHSQLRKLLKVSEVFINNNNVKNDANENGADFENIYKKVECSIGQYLCATSSTFDLESNVHNVCKQIWDTLFDYPCLVNCSSLTDFIRQCIRLCWAFQVNNNNQQNNQFTIDIDTKTFREDWHCRSIDSDCNSNHIKCYIWPTLFQHGICVHKGVVIT